MQEKVMRWKEVIDLTIGDAPPEIGATMESLQPGNESAQQKKESSDSSDEIQELFVFDRRGVEDAESEKKVSGGSPADAQSETLSKLEERRDDRSSEEESDEDSDDADKLEELWSRSVHKDGGFGHEEERVAGLPFDDGDDEGEESMAIKARRPRGQSMVSLSSATTCSEGERFDDSGMEVSFTVGNSSGANRPLGPTGRNRTAVVNALYKIAKRMRPHATTLHVRKKASKFLCDEGQSRWTSAGVSKQSVSVNFCRLCRSANYQFPVAFWI